MQAVVALLVVALPAAAWLARRLDALDLGDDAAAALGVRVEPARLALVVVGVALVAGPSALTGPIKFVALPVILPVGLVTIVLGGGYLTWLLTRQARKELA